jgi:DNA (cytosine-5)-methyltransferase 3A
LIKILLGGSPCTHWSIAQKNNRETKPEGLGWELFKNYLIAKEKFKPDLFLYENNKSAAQPIKDQISQELGVDLMHINSALVSAQNRQRFYAFNWDVEQPEDRGILLRDILVTSNFDCDKCHIQPMDLTGNDKSYTLTTTYGCCVPHDTINRKRRNMIVEPLGVGYRGRTEDGKWKKRYESNGEAKANALTTAQTDSMVAEPVAVDLQVVGRKRNEDGVYERSWEARTDGKSSCLTTVETRRMVADPVYIGEVPEHNGSYRNGKQPSQQYRVYSSDAKAVAVTTGAITNVAQPVRAGAMPRPNGEMSTSQAKRIYAIDGKSVNLTSNGGGEGAKTGMYAIPAQYPYALPIEWCEKGKPTKAISGADGKAYTVYEVRDGIITIKEKQYPIKLPDGFYIIRKLTPVECERLQTLPDGYTRAVSNAQRYKGLGNGWTAEVIIHILNGVLKDVPRDEEIVVLSMYDGIGTGRYCLDKMGFKNVRYYAYEIDKYAKQVAMSNYPDIIQCGDAFDIRHPDWTIGY